MPLKTDRIDLPYLSAEGDVGGCWGQEGRTENRMQQLQAMAGRRRALAAGHPNDNVRTLSS
jgi:hypothetical protein